MLSFPIGRSHLFAASRRIGVAGIPVSGVGRSGDEALDALNGRSYWKNFPNLWLSRGEEIGRQSKPQPSPVKPGLSQFQQP